VWPRRFALIMPYKYSSTRCIFKKQVHLSLWYKKCSRHIPLLCDKNVAIDCVLQLLLNNGVDIGIRDNDGMTALMWCCRGDHLHHLRLLLKQVCERFPDDCLSDYDTSGKTWLHWCVRRMEPLNCFQVECNVNNVNNKSIECEGTKVSNALGCRLQYWANRSF